MTLPFYTRLGCQHCAVSLTHVAAAALPPASLISVSISGARRLRCYCACALRSTLTSACKDLKGWGVTTRFTWLVNEIKVIHSSIFIRFFLYLAHKILFCYRQKKARVKPKLCIRWVQEGQTLKYYLQFTQIPINFKIIPLFPLSNQYSVWTECCGFQLSNNAFVH